MGSSSSKKTPIEASEEEQARWGKVFDLVCDDNGKLHEAEFDKVFEHDALLKSFPDQIRERIFTVFGQASANDKKSSRSAKNFITKDAFLRGVAIIAHGSPSERIQLLFNVYDYDATGSITKREMKYFMKALRDTFNEDMRAEESATLVRNLFDEADKNEDGELHFEEFKEWAESQVSNSTPSVVSWIFELGEGLMQPDKDGQGVVDGDGDDSSHLHDMVSHVELEEEDLIDAPSTSALWLTRRFSMALNTKLTDKEAAIVEKQYHRLCSQAPSSIAKLTFAHLASVFAQGSQLPRSLVQPILATFHSGGARDLPGKSNSFCPKSPRGLQPPRKSNPTSLTADSGLSCRDFLKGVGLLVRGSKQDYSRLCYDAFRSSHGELWGKKDLGICLQSFAEAGLVHDGNSKHLQRGFTCSPSSFSSSSSLAPVTASAALLRHSEDSSSKAGLICPIDSKGINAPATSSSYPVDRVFISKLTSDVFSKYSNGGLHMTHDKFVSWLGAEGIELSFFPRLREFCLIELGLHPIDSLEERDILRSRWQYEAKEGARLFLLEYEWAKMWAKYCGFDLKVAVDATPFASETESGLGSQTPNKSTITREREEKLQSPEQKRLSRYSSEKGDTPRKQQQDIKPQGRRQQWNLLSPNRRSETKYNATFLTPKHQKRKSATEDTYARPNELDNSGLVLKALPDAEEALLLPNLKHGEHYVAVPERAWQALQGWYEGGPVIERRLVQVGRSDAKRRLILELYPLVLTVLSSVREAPITVLASRTSTVTDLLVKLRHVYSLDPEGPMDTIRVWDMFEKTNPSLLSKEQTLDECHIVSDQTLYFEVQLANGRWEGCTSDEDNNTFKNVDPETLKGLNLSEYNNGGLCGLYNLGNTCFMASAVQSLSMCYPLSQYFLSETYLHEINEESLLGMQGKLAMAFGLTCQQLWSGAAGKAIAPRTLKWVIGKYAPQFQGTHQHDSQELLAFLLDGLHEDLNRVFTKPYITYKDHSGRPDAIVAEEYWKNYLQREKSLIVDLFAGQVRSVIKHPCGYESVTFDPYRFLSLPLPKQQARRVELVVVFDNPSRVPTRYTVNISPEIVTVLHVKEMLSKMCGVKTNRMQFADLWENREDEYYVHEFMVDNNRASYLRSSDVTYVYVTPPRATLESAERLLEAQRAEEAQRTAAENAKKGIIAVGDVFDVFDTYNKWLEGTVIKIQKQVFEVLKEPADPPLKVVREESGSFQSEEEVDSGVEVVDSAPSTSRSSFADDSDNMSLDGLSASNVDLAPKSATDRRKSKERVTRTKVSLRIHYIGWPSKWDEWITLGSNRIVTHRTHTKPVGVRANRISRTAELDVPLETTVCLHVRHRLLIKVDNYLLHPYEPRVFHTPSLLYINKETTTYADLYKMLWRRAGAYTALPKRSVGQLFADEDTKQSQNEQFDAGMAFPPFRLKKVRRNARQCSQCSWTKMCLGCVIPYSDAVVDKSLQRDDVTIAVDWNPSFFESYLNERELRDVINDVSTVEHRKLMERPVSIRDCVSQFTAPEFFDKDAVPRCTKCKDWHTGVSKTLQLWSMPRILIVHLKRLLPNEKIYTMVDAPLRGFDPLPFLASHKVQRPDYYDEEPDWEGDPDLAYKPDAKLEATDPAKAVERKEKWTLGRAAEIKDWHAEKERLAEILDSEGKTEDGARLQKKYDLFAVVTHYGSMRGGHYVATAKCRKDNKWYMFNDHKVTEVEERDVVTKGAYMLFYAQRGTTDDYLSELTKLQDALNAAPEKNPKKVNVLKNSTRERLSRCCFCRRGCCSRYAAHGDESGEEDSQEDRDVPEEEEEEEQGGS
jgi:ubiquitin C-terminal hydrolase/Ca2+-binding EF-hand superfamily protein